MNGKLFTKIFLPKSKCFYQNLFTRINFYQNLKNAFYQNQNLFPKVKILLPKSFYQNQILPKFNKTRSLHRIQQNVKFHVATRIICDSQALLLPSRCPSPCPFPGAASGPLRLRMTAVKGTECTKHVIAEKYKSTYTHTHTHTHTTRTAHKNRASKAVKENSSGPAGQPWTSFGLFIKNGKVQIWTVGTVQRQSTPVPWPAHPSDCTSQRTKKNLRGGARVHDCPNLIILC